MPSTSTALVTLALAAAVACQPSITDEPPPPFPELGVGGAGGTHPPFSGSGGRGFGGGGSPAAVGFLARPAVSSPTFTPAISGGTLLVLADGNTAFAADPDRDALYLADLRGERLLTTLTLQPGDQPGRAVEDGTGALHVVLRGAGAILTVAADRTLGERRQVCAAPRGIAHDKEGGALHVACAGGELVTLPVAGGAATRTVFLDRDLRDLVKSGDKLFISRFRAAELLVVSAATGKLLARATAPGSLVSRAAAGPGIGHGGSSGHAGSSGHGGVTGNGSAATGGAPGSAAAPLPAPTPGQRAALPGVAWRLRLRPDGGVAMIHQESTTAELRTEPGGYTGGVCNAPIAAAITTVAAGTGTLTTSGQISMAALPVDFAYSRDGLLTAMLFAGGSNPGGAVALSTVQNENVTAGGCAPPNQLPPPQEVEFRQPVSDPVAMDFDGQGRLVVQTREPARLEILTHRGGSIKLSEQSRFDSGHAVFHTATPAGLSCAGCHPEGGDDGQVWRFAGLGPRRTQNLMGGIARTAPFHWDGDMRDLGHLMSEVFTGRMGGPTVSADHVTALGEWMGRLPAPPLAWPRDGAAATRGKLLFQDAKVGCATCHSGPLFTNNTTVAVGTGKAFQVPSLLGIGGRAPFMHDGCARTLADRFVAPCGGGDAHGVTSTLSPAQLSDLIAYLEML